MKITILGAGTLGQVLIRAWCRVGHQVTVGVRQPVHHSPIEGVPLLSVEDAIADDAAQVIVFAVPTEVVPQIATAYSHHLTGKVVIDPTVRFGSPVINNRACFLDHEVSYVRAFNTLDPVVLAHPFFDAERADLFFAALDVQGHAIAHALIEDLGLRPVYVGGEEAIAVVDGVTRLWFALAVKQGHGDHLAFRMLGDS